MSNTAMRDCKYSMAIFEVFPTKNSDKYPAH